MRYTCGIIFYRNGQILVGHATGQKHWDLPKGKSEKNESFSQAAVRECYEEIGFEINEDDLMMLGVVPYQKGKKLVLFYYKSKYKPEISNLTCNSTYTNKYGHVKPEFDKFKYIDLEDCNTFLTNRMCKSIVYAVTKFKKNN